MLFEVSPLACFGLCLASFHLSEVLLVLLLEPEELRWSTTLLSRPYILAMLCGLLEHLLIRPLYIPTSISLPCLSLGLALVITGELIRKSAWITARASFTHLIKETRRPQHKLVMGGIYSFSRHPGYLGWLIWAVGTQVMLANPFCTVAFGVTGWRFFKVRIPYEEWHLFQLFGEDYAKYRRRVPTRIPFIP